MNVLDSELVVGQPAQEGYELTDDAGRGRHDPLQHLLASASTPRTRSTAPSAASERQAASNPTSHRRPRLHGPEGPGADPQAGARTSILIVGPGQLAQVPELVREIAPKATARTQRMAVSLGRKDGTREQIERSFTRASTRSATRRCGPTPFQAYRPHHDRLRQVLHLLHRAQVRGPEQSRPPRQIVAESRNSPTKAARKSPSSARRSTATSTAKDDRTARLSDLLAALHDIDGIERIKFVTNYPKDMTDDLLAGRPRPAEGLQYLHVPAQSGCERGAEADEAGLHGRGLSRDARPHRASRCRASPSQRLHRRLLRRDRGRVPAHDGPGRASRRSKTASSSSTANAPARRPPSCTPTTCRTK